MANGGTAELADLAKRVEVVGKSLIASDALLDQVNARVEALEAAYATSRNVSVPETDALLARAGAFLRALKRSATAVPVSLWPEYEALLLELDG